MGKEIESSPPEDAHIMFPAFWRPVLQIFLPSGAFIGDAASYLIKNLQPGICDFYLCGEREMIRGVTLLVDEHFAGSHVYTEVFY